MAGQLSLKESKHTQAAASDSVSDELFTDLPKGFMTREDFANLTSSNRSCADFRKNRQYLPHPLSLEEAKYPIAYSILIHKDLQTFERMLRSIYQPQNFYCIHVDQKSGLSK